MKKEYTDEQRAIFNWVQNGAGSGIINAVAGAGKTSTMITALRYMQGNVFFGAFNKSVAEDIKKKLPCISTPAQVNVSTLHAEGFKQMRFVYPRSVLDKDKYQKIFAELAASGAFPLMSEMNSGRLKPYRYLVSKAVSLGRQWLLDYSSEEGRWMSLFEHFGITSLVQRELDLEVILANARALLRVGVGRIPDVFDFEDVIYAASMDKKFSLEISRRYDWVIVDEAQDTNDSRRAFLKTLLKPGGRFVAVGDPYQAIYGFSGADANSMFLIKEEFDCNTELSLSTTFRSPKKIIEQVKEYVPHIRAHEANSEGEIIDLEKQPNFNFKTFLKQHEFPSDAVILCRNSKQLVEAYLQFIKRGLYCHIEGSDLGKDYLFLLRKFQKSDLKTFRKSLLEPLEEYRREIANGQDEEKNLKRIECIETLIGVSDSFDTFDDLLSFFEKAFKDTRDEEAVSYLTLSTVHKAKGREWHTVYLLGRKELMPSKHAKKPWQIEQEKNLVYVALTRAKHTLIEVPISEVKKNNL